ncbi:sensor histidine kinase [Nocardioides sp. Bht2]|uniref:sensor histidine kinase n=1 Tax=Nocardioides sp. Bht2 TaxID=3392297 RepID=UPI0039B411C5
MRCVVLLRAFVTGLDGDSATAGWATRSLSESIRGALFAAVALFQALVILALLLSPGDGTWLLVAFHLLIAGIAWTARHRPIPGSLVVAAVYGIGLLDIALTSSADSLVTFVVCWMINLAHALPAFLMRRWSAVLAPLVGSVGYAVGVHLLHPDWGGTYALAVPPTALFMMLGTRAGAMVLADLTGRIDAQAAAGAEETAALAWRRRVSRETAEDARVLHDTVINTLGALAMGGAAISDGALVRARCRSDADTVITLHHGVAGPTAPASLPQALAHHGLFVERRGLDDAEVAGLLALIDADRARAFISATNELVRNVAKHAGVDRVVVDARHRGGRLQLAVLDAGRGFDQDRVELRGLLSSVFARAQEAGIRVSLRSEPGSGTAAVLSVDLEASSTDGLRPGRVDDDAEKLDQVLAQMRRNAAWLWAAGAASVGVGLEVVNHPGRATWTYLTLVVAFAGLAIARVAYRRRRRLPAGIGVALGMLASIGFVAAAATSGFGEQDVVLWQVVSPTGLLVLLTMLPGVAGVRYLGFGLFIGTVLVTAVVGTDSLEPALIVGSGGLIALTLVLGFVSFGRVVGRIAARTRADQQRLLDARLDGLERDAATEARGRWRAAGLSDALELLEELADGRLDPHDSEVRRRCGEEELYLRQLIQLNPELVRMSHWYLRALGEAKVRRVSLILRSGEVEPDDAETVRVMGENLLRAVNAVRPSDDLTMTLYGGDSGVTLTMVGPNPMLSEQTGRWQVPMGAQLRVQSIGGQDVVEFALPTELKEAVR